MSTPRFYNKCRLILLTAVVAAITLLPLPGLAQTSLTSEVSPTSGRTDDLFLFTVTAEGATPGSAPQLTPSQDFDVKLIGPRTAISIVNGAMSSRISYIYQLTPKREGTLNTPKAEMTINGQRLTAEPIEITISENPAASKGAGDASSEGVVLLRQTVSDLTPYQGQQIVHATTVYTRANLSELSMEDPTTDGFWQEPITERKPTQRIYDGKEYTAVEVTKALFPLQSGSIKLPARRLTAQIPTQQRARPRLSLDPFSDDFFQQFWDRMGAQELQPISVRSNELTVDVKPLPPLPGAMREISPSVPLVGATTMKVDYPLDAINTGETKVVKVEVTSEANLNTLKSVTLPSSNKFKVYEGRPESRVSLQNGKLITHKTFSFSVVPLSPGLSRIPGARLAYFDPTTGRYETAATEDIAFPIRGADLTATQSQHQPSVATSEPASTSAAIPTLPAPPIGPDLSYEEPTLLESISNYISVQLAILLLTFVCGVGCISVIASRGKTEESKAKSSTAGLRDIRDIRELEGFIRETIARKLPQISESSSMDEIRSRVSTSLRDKHISLAISSLLDDIEVVKYGAPAGDNEQQVGPMKERLAMILMQWR